MLDEFEKRQLEKMSAKYYLLLDALTRASGDTNEEALDRDQFGYVWIQLTKASSALEKLRTYVLSTRTRRQQRPATVEELLTEQIAYPPQQTNGD